MIRLTILLAMTCVLLSSPVHARRYTLEKYYARHHSNYVSRSAGRHRHHAAPDRKDTERLRFVAKPPIPYPYAVGNAVTDAFTGGQFIADRSCLVDGDGYDIPRFRIHSNLR